jgi:Peptidase C13 family
MISLRGQKEGEGVSGVWSVLKLAARAAMWRTTPDPPLVGLPALIGWTLVLAVERVAIQYADAAPSPGFTPYGLNALVAWLAIMLAVAAFFMRPQARTTALAAMVALSVIVEGVLSAIQLAAARLLPASDPSELLFSWFPALNVDWFADLVGLALPIAFVLAPAVSWIGGMFVIVYSLQGGARLRLLGTVVALWAALFVAKGVVPHAPVFVAPGFDVSTANWWEYIRAGHLAHAATEISDRVKGRAKAKPSAAQVEKTQPALMQTAVARLAPQTPGTTDVYALAVAGWSDLDVFLKEIDGALDALGQVLPIRDRALRLVNNRTTLDTVPLASRRNLAAAVHAIAALMDKDEDVLLLVLSSHGAANGFALQLPAGSSQLLTPHELKGVLDAEGIKNRIVIVSACYSGTFVAPLANEDTIVLTAADEKSTSFGCAAQRDWTYFGDAFFRQSLHPGADLKGAFDHARILIQSWETLDRLPPSNPQAHFGSALTARLAPVLESIARGGQ